MGKWVSYIRRIHRLVKQGRRARGKRLSDERIVQLKSIGFVFELKETMAMTRFKEGMVLLREFYLKEGHCVVPKFLSSNPTFGLCVEEMRKEYRKYAEGKDCILDKEILNGLTSMGFLSEEEIFVPYTTDSEQANQPLQQEQQELPPEQVVFSQTHPQQHNLQQSISQINPPAELQQLQQSEHSIQLQSETNQSNVVLS